ncbi:MAG: alpha/beta fold hydrolase, partial [Myxococcota bacterium]
MPRPRDATGTATACSPAVTDLEVLRVDVDAPRRHIVLLHGAWHGAWCWLDGFAQRLAAAGISSTIPSLRGHGGSPGGKALNRLRLRDYVDDLAEVLGTLDAPPYVLGHSMGGGIVQMLLAREDAPPIAGAVLMAPLPPSGVLPATLRTLRQAPAAFLHANATLDMGKIVRTPKLARRAFFAEGTPEQVVQASVERLRSESYLAFLDMLLFDRPPRRAPPSPPPMLVLGGSEDTIFRPS